MKRSIVTTLLAAGLLAAFTTAASADHGRIDRRQARQHGRIADGARCGDLTRGESKRLRSGQRRVQRMQHRAWRDGRLSRMEQRRIDRMQDRQSRTIYRLRHNGRQRVW